MAPSLPSSLYGFHDTKAWGRLMATPEWIALRNPILFTLDSQFHSLVHGTKDNVEWMSLWGATERKANHFSVLVSSNTHKLESHLLASPYPGTETYKLINRNENACVTKLPWRKEVKGKWCDSLHRQMLSPWGCTNEPILTLSYGPSSGLANSPSCLPPMLTLPVRSIHGIFAECQSLTLTPVALMYSHEALQK